MANDDVLLNGSRGADASGYAPGDIRRPRPPGSAAPPTAPAVEPARNLDAILRIPVTVQVVLGSTTMPVSDLMKLGRGAVVPLDRRVGEPVEVVVNGRVVARGEMVVLEEDHSRFGVSLTEIVGSPNSERPA